jgi:predicted nucleic acid-binding protein
VKIVDAGTIVDSLTGGLYPDELGADELAAPHLLDSEVLGALRGLVHRGELTAGQGDDAVAAFTELSITRWPADWLRARIWALRDTLTAYDATYVALAETLEATLITTDTRLAAAPGPTCRIEVPPPREDSSQTPAENTGAEQE